MPRNKLFIRYSRTDGRWLKRVREQLGVLEREGLIDTFDDTQIGAGKDWYGRLDREMAEARIALLLISASFLASPFIRKEEIPRLMERHQSDGMELYPLLVRDCAWQLVGWLSSVQMRPPGLRAIASMRAGALDTCLAGVAREIASIVQKERTSTPARVIDRKGVGVSIETPPSAGAVPDFSGEWQGMWLSVKAQRGHHARLVIPEGHGETFSALMTVTYERSGRQTVVKETLAGAIVDGTISLIGAKYTYVERGASASYSLDNFSLQPSDDGNTLSGQAVLRGGVRDITFRRVIDRA